MEHNLTQILFANKDIFAKSKNLFINPIERIYFVENQSVTINFQDSKEQDIAWNLFLEDHFDNIVIFVSKEKKLTVFYIDVLSFYAQKIYLVGDNKSGIKSLVLNFDNIKIDSRRHCQLFNINFKEKPQKNWNNYFTFYDFDKLKIANFPGIFAHDRLDKGTKLLLSLIDEKLKNVKSVLDYGAGSGVIGAFVLQNNPNVCVDFLDNSYISFLCCSKTLEINCLKANFVSGFDLSDAKTYDLIVSNPPFHRGKEIEYEVALNLIKDSKKHLNFNGKLMIVANDFLPYFKVLNSHFTKVEILLKKDGFIVYLAHD